MTFPKKNASAMDIITFLKDYNILIHNAILAGKDYTSLIGDLVDANLYENCFNFSDATVAIHTTKLRYFVNKRDVTHDVNYIWDDIPVDNKDLTNQFDALVLTTESEQENVIAYLNNKDDPDAYVDTQAVLYLKQLDKLLHFQTTDEKNYSENLQDFKLLLQQLEKEYYYTGQSLFLPLCGLSTYDNKIIQYTEATEELDNLLYAIFENWDTVNPYAPKYATPPIAIATPGVGSHYNLNSHLESMGLYRKQYYRFCNGDVYPAKKLVLGMALYFAPNNPDDIEDFMNAFGYSLRSNVFEITEKKLADSPKNTLLDKDIRKLLSSGLDTELITMLIGEKSNTVKKNSYNRFS